jgi:hypothetical protein
MWLLAQKLIVLHQQNTQKYSGMAANLSLNSSQTKWILDSGVTDHMTGNENLLYNFRKYEINQFVTVANEEKIKFLVVVLLIYSPKKYQISCLSKIAHPICYQLANLQIN